MRGRYYNKDHNASEHGWGRRRTRHLDAPADRPVQQNSCRGLRRWAKRQSGNGPAGQADAYREYLAGCNASAYLQAEMEARTSQLGVWRFVQEYPWEFRKSRRK